MRSNLVSGFCDPRFADVETQFSQALDSGFETGASIAVEHQGQMVVNLWGGHKDRAKTQPWREDTLVNVFSTTKAVTRDLLLTAG
jgi:Beta-lactamase class C and other penicillin binding proteins